MKWMALLGFINKNKNGVGFPKHLDYLQPFEFDGRKSDYSQDEWNLLRSGTNYNYAYLPDEKFNDETVPNHKYLLSKGFFIKLKKESDFVYGHKNEDRFHIIYSANKFGAAYNHQIIYFEYYFQIEKLYFLITGKYL